jgi:hypothetical protein
MNWRKSIVSSIFIVDVKKPELIVKIYIEFNWKELDHSQQVINL